MPHPGHESKITASETAGTEGIRRQVSRVNVRK